MAAFSLTAAGMLPALPAAAHPDAGISSGTSTPANCTIQLSVRNPNPGDQEIPRTLDISGTAVDTTAVSGTGIAQVEAFLGNRDQGGAFLGAARFANDPATAPGAWSLTTDIPASVIGGQSVVIYSMSSVSGQEAFVSIPVVVGEALPVGLVSDQGEVFCPSTAAPPTPTPVALAAEPTPAPAQPAPTEPAPPTPAPVAPTLEPPAPTLAPAPTTVPTSPPVAAAPPMATQLNISSPLSPPLTFNTNTLSAPAGAEVTVTYSNDSPIDHDWHVFNGPDSSSGTLATTQIITGPGASDSVTFTAPTQPGNYFFWCDVHPTIMTGTLVVN